MATKTVAAGGGNFNAGTTWIGGVAPISGDDIVANASSGNLTLVINTVNLLGANFTGYTGTLALGSFNMFFTSSPGGGTITLSPTMTITRTIGLGGTFRISQPITIVSNGKEIPFSVSGSPTITLSGDLTVNILTLMGAPTITGGANFIITDSVPAALSSTSVAAGSKVIYRPANNSVTFGTGSPIGTGHYQFDTSGTVSVGAVAGFYIVNSAATPRNASTIVEFLQTPIWTGVGTFGGKPIFNYYTNSNTYNGLTTSIIMATNSTISQFIMDGGNNNTIGLSIQNRLNIDEISFKSSLGGNGLYNVFGSGGFSASRTMIMAVKNPTALSNLGTQVRFAADAEYIIGSLNVTGFIGNSPSVTLSSLTSSVPVNMNISNGGFSYAQIADINNTGTSLYALSANGNILTRTTGFISSPSAGGGGETSVTFVN